MRGGIRAIELQSLFVNDSRDRRDIERERGDGNKKGTDI